MIKIRVYEKDLNFDQIQKISSKLINFKYFYLSFLAFMVWSREERQKICNVQPDKHNAEISKELGQRWRRMSKEERREYEDKAEELRQLHVLEYPE